MAEKRISDLTDAGAVTGEELVAVSKLSDTIFIVGTTISAQASDNSFNDSANGFLTAGFAIGDRVRVEGFTGNAANNLFVGILTAVAAGKLTIGGTDGDVIVDDAAGESVTISKWISRRTPLSNAAGETDWTLAGSYDFAASPAIKAFFTGLAGANDILIIFDSVTISSSANLIVELSSTDGSGETPYYNASGNYVLIDSAGAEAAASNISLFAANATTARSGAVEVFGCNVGHQPKLCRTRRGDFLFAAADVAINAVSVGNNGAGNCNGGKVHVYTR